MFSDSDVAASASSSSSNAFSFISKGWREVKDSADADLQLMKDRANSFKNLATSFDRELENFFSSASTFSVPAIRSPPPAEIDFVKKLKPKLSEIRRAYSSPDFSKKVLEKWGPRSRIRIDLSAIKNAIVSEVEDRDGTIDLHRVRRGRRLTFGEFWGEWKAEGEAEEGESSKDWEPIRVLKTRLKEFEKRNASVEIFGGFKNSEFVEKVKTSLVCSLLLSALSRFGSSFLVFVVEFVEIFTWFPLNLWKFQCESFKREFSFLFLVLFFFFVK